MDTSGVTAQLLSGGTVDGTLYGIPPTQNTQVSLLEPAPPPPPKGAGTVKATFQRVYDDVIFERSTPAQAAEKFMSEAQKAISAS